MIIIGLSGKARSGKNSVTHLTRILMDDDRCTKVLTIAMADALKQEARSVVQDAIEAVGYTVLPKGASVPVFLPDGAKFRLNLDDLTQKTPEGRRFLQYYGTEYRRKQDPDYWTKRMEQRIHQINKGPNPPQIVFIADVRFPNEADFIRARDGNLVRVNRYNSDGTHFDNGLTAGQKAHPSETALDNYEFDFYINASNMQGLFECVKDLLPRMLEPESAKH